MMFSRKASADTRQNVRFEDLVSGLLEPRCWPTSGLRLGRYPAVVKPHATQAMSQMAYLSSD
jgi:hypothetical protein